MWLLFKDILKGNSFPNIPVSLTIKNLKVFKEEIQSNKNNIQFIEVVETPKKTELNFKLIKKYSFHEYYNFPSYHFRGKVLKNDKTLKLEGEFVERGLGKGIQWFSFFNILLLLIFLIFDVVFLFERGIEKNSYILLLFTLSPFAMFSLVALSTWYLRKIENTRIKVFMAVILKAAQL